MNFAGNYAYAIYARFMQTYPQILNRKMTFFFPNWKKYKTVPRKKGGRLFEGNTDFTNKADYKQFYTKLTIRMTPSKFYVVFVIFNKLWNSCLCYFSSLKGCN